MLKPNQRVDITSYYQPGELDQLRFYVVNNQQFETQQKLQAINAKINRLKQQ